MIFFIFGIMTKKAWRWCFFGSRARNLLPGKFIYLSSNSCYQFWLTDSSSRNKSLKVWLLHFVLAVDLVLQYQTRAWSEWQFPAYEHNRNVSTSRSAVETNIVYNIDSILYRVIFIHLFWQISLLIRCLLFLKKYPNVWKIFENAEMMNANDKRIVSFLVFSWL